MIQGKKCFAYIITVLLSICSSLLYSGELNEFSLKKIYISVYLSLCIRYIKYLISLGGLFFCIVVTHADENHEGACVMHAVLPVVSSSHTASLFSEGYCVLYNRLRYTLFLLYTCMVSPPIHCIECCQNIDLIIVIRCNQRACRNLMYIC